VGSDRRRHAAHANALDFLDAPSKLSEAIDSPAVEWFRKLKGERGSRWSVVGKTGAYVLKRLAKFVGSKFIDDIGVFFTEFNDILGGFRQRAEETFALLRQPRVGFVLVASPSRWRCARRSRSTPGWPAPRCRSSASWSTRSTCRADRGDR